MQRGTVTYRQWIGVLGQRLPDGVSEKRHVRRAGAALPRSLQPVHAPSTAAGLAALDKITDPLRRGGSPALAADPGQPPQIRLGTLLLEVATAGASRSAFPGVTKGRNSRSDPISKIQQTPSVQENRTVPFDMR